MTDEEMVEEITLWDQEVLALQYKAEQIEAAKIYTYGWVDGTYQVVAVTE